MTLQVDLEPDDGGHTEVEYRSEREEGIKFHEYLLCIRYIIGVNNS